MDTQIANWEMSVTDEPQYEQQLKEEIASWPSEPYKLDVDHINWN